MEALAATRPPDSTLDGDARRFEVRRPRRQVTRGDGEGQMLHAVGAVGRDHAARRLERRQGYATLEQQQDALAVDIERKKPWRVEQDTRAEDVDVEPTRPSEIGDVERRLDDPP